METDNNTKIDRLTVDTDTQFQEKYAGVAHTLVRCSLGITVGGAEAVTLHLVTAPYKEWIDKHPDVTALALTPILMIFATVATAVACPGISLIFKKPLLPYHTTETYLTNRNDPK